MRKDYQQKVSAFTVSQNKIVAVLKEEMSADCLTDAEMLQLEEMVMGAIQNKKNKSMPNLESNSVH